MTEQDMIIQDLRREVAQLRAELEWKQKEIELAQRHARQWISVERDLPRDFVDVLIWDEIDKAMFTGHYNEFDGWAVDGFGDSKYDFKISHWMPLPEPPKEAFA